MKQIIRNTFNLVMSKIRNKPKLAKKKKVVRRNNFGFPTQYEE